VNNRNMIMPECISKILVIRAPDALVYAWGIFKRIVDPGIARKVKVASASESLALLRQYISDDQIPAYLGGSLRTGGDAECRQVLAPGGPIPEAAFRRFLQLAAAKPRQPGQQDGRQESIRTGSDRVAAEALGSCGMCCRRW